MSGIFESVWIGRDGPLLDAMLDFYAPRAQRVIDVSCNARRIWADSRWASRVLYYDIDPAQAPDVVADWRALPDVPDSVDILIYDPPHLPLAAASAKSHPGYRSDFGLGHSVGGSNIAALHPPFLAEAKRVLRPDGLIFAKIKDYVHNHTYQFNLELFHAAARAAGLTPCDLVIKRDPKGGGLRSSRWQNLYHARNVHSYWSVIRKGKCEPRSKRPCVSPSFIPPAELSRLVRSSVAGSFGRLIPKRSK